jgi:hypothetical protein
MAGGWLATVHVFDDFGNLVELGTPGIQQALVFTSQKA